MNVFLANVDKALKDRRERRPWLAQESGVGLSTINNWFTYDRFPMVDQANMVAKALRIPLDTLMGETVTPPELSEIKASIWRWLAAMPDEESKHIMEMCKLAIVLTLDQATNLLRPKGSDD